MFDVLLIELKRYSSSRTVRDKLELKVDYPVEDLNTSDMVRDRSDGMSFIYDLIAAATTIVILLAPVTQL